MYIICGYHAKCMDGLASAWVVQKYAENLSVKGDKFIAIPMNYKEDSYNRFVDKVQEVWRLARGQTIEVFIVDFHLPVKALDSIGELLFKASSDRKCYTFDHHKTTFETYKSWLPEGTYELLEKGTLEDIEITEPQNILNLCLSLKESGASLVWKKLFPEQEPPVAIKYIKDRDLWLHKLPYTKEVNATIKNSCDSFELSDMDAVIKALETPIDFDDAIETGKKLLAEKQQVIDILVARSFQGLLTGVDKPVVMVVGCPPELASDVGNALAEIAPSSIGICELAFGPPDLSSDSIPVTQYSIRSIGDVDVSEIAKQYGGGGHKNAAGFTLEGSELHIGVIPNE